MNSSTSRNEKYLQLNGNNRSDTATNILIYSLIEIGRTRMPAKKDMKINYYHRRGALGIGRWQ